MNTCATSHHMPATARPRKRRGIEKSRPRHVDENDDTTRVMRREWKYNKPYLRRSDSLPTLSILSSTRPHFICQQCRFTNTAIPMCLWCCWTSKESEALFEKSMPRARRMSAPMRISGAVDGRTKKRVTEANSGSHQNGKVTDAIRIQRVDIMEPTTDGCGNIVISPNRFLPRMEEVPSGNSDDISDRRGSAADTRKDIVSEQRGASYSRRSFINGAAGMEGRLGLRRSDLVGERGVVGQKGVGQKTVHPTKAKSGVELNRPLVSEGVSNSIASAAASANISTPSSTNSRPLLPLRLRRLKGDATPLQINSQVNVPMTHVSYSTSTLQTQSTKKTRKLPRSPRIFQGIQRLSLSRSPPKWPNCISDAETSDAENDRSIMIPSVPSRSSDSIVQTNALTGERPAPPTTRNAATETKPDRFYPPYAFSPRSPWSKSDPFGELLGLDADMSTNAIHNPSFSLTSISTMPTPITPTSPGRADVTRHRAATVTGYDQSVSHNPYPYHSYPITPTSPNSSVYTLSSRTPKPLYASIRKEGMYRSPLPSPRSSNSALKPTSTPSPASRVSFDANNSRKGNNTEFLSPSPYPSNYPSSPKPSPLSSVFPPYINPAPDDDARISSLSLASRSSSTEGSCGGDCILLDAFESQLRMKESYRDEHKRELIASWAKSGQRFDGNIESREKATGMRQRSRDRSTVRTNAADIGGGLMGMRGIRGMGAARAPPVTSNPNLMNQRLFRVPLASTGPGGFGCSMSGETELKLALRARERYEDDIPRGQGGLASKTMLPEVDDTILTGEMSLFLGEDRHAVESQTNCNAKPLMRRLREMVSTGFLRHGDGG